MAHELYYVTGNIGKFEEVQSFINRTNPTIDLKQIDFDLSEMQTLDQRGIAIDKAKQAWEKVQKPLLVDDAGIYFEAYHRFPGALTKFVYQGLGFKGILKLVDEDHRAYFIVYIVYIDGPDSYQVFEGRCDGKIVPPKEIIAHPLLPFNDIFVPAGSDLTYAELCNTAAVESFNARVKALQEFLSWYKK